MVLIGLAFTGPALMVTALASDWQTFQYYMTLAVTPMMMLCGVFYPLDAFPPGLQAFAQALPLTHAVDLLRPLMAGQPAEGLWGHALYLLLFTLASGAGAMLLLRRRLTG
jgi:lipooligosaccharide transport system permease protein